MYVGIVNREATGEEIRDAARESPLGALREMLPDRRILDACFACGHSFRDRRFGPVATVFHFLLQAVQREESFAATWQEIWAPLAADFPELASIAPARSGLCHARGRLPVAVMQTLCAQAVSEAEEVATETWRGLRLLALDGTTVSMPRNRELFERFGAHRARNTTARHPLARFSSLLAVGSSLILDYRFGPFGPGEIVSATPLLATLGCGDLLLADRGFAGGPTFARVYARGADFLMRKNARLIVPRLPVLRRLGREDFVTEIPMNEPARKLDPSLPGKVRCRIFRASWRAPSGQRLTQWFVTSLLDPKRFGKRALARLYHKRWRIETSYNEFKTLFHSDVLRRKTPDTVEKEMAAHVLAYQLVRRLIVAAARKHLKKPTEISFLDAARWTISFSRRMAASPAWALPILYQRLLDTIAASDVDARPGRIEPRALARDRRHYPSLRIPRLLWRSPRAGRSA